MNLGVAIKVTLTAPRGTPTAVPVGSQASADFLALGLSAACRNLSSHDGHRDAILVFFFSVAATFVFFLAVRANCVSFLASLACCT